MSHRRSASLKATQLSPQVTVVTVPILEDNYSYLVIDHATSLAAAVDPAEPPAVLAAARTHRVRISTILTTHRHWDHAGGNAEMVQRLGKDAVDVLGEGSGGRVVHQGQRWTIRGSAVGGWVVEAACHTRGHVCYVVEGGESEDAKKAAFTGDCLFIGGCGRFFEGDGKDMVKALDSIGSLDSDVLVFCGHEYTEKNLKFALTVDPENEDLKRKMEWVRDVRAKGEFTVPSSVGQEKAFNPFMRVHTDAIAKAVGLPPGADRPKVMSALRTLKDNF